MVITSINKSAQGARTIGLHVIPILSIGLYLTLSFALMRSMVIDTYGLVQTRLDLMAYWTCLLISAILSAWLLSQRKLQIFPFFLASFLIFYAAYILTLTAPELSPVAFLVSRYGILFWFILGVGAGAVFDCLQQAREQGKTLLTKMAFILVVSVIGALMVQFALQYLALPVRTFSYQSVSNSLSIFLVMTVGATEALWGKRKPMFLSIGYLFAGTIIVAAVVRMHSNSILALWVGIILIFFWGLIRNSRMLSQVALVAALLGGAAFFTGSEVFEDITTNTRLSVFFAGGGGLGEFSSLTSRVAIANSFFDQFAVSPVFGNFRAEILAGAGIGNYVHSVPLSFLTHTGIVGTFLFFATLVFLLRRRLVNDTAIDQSERQFARLMIVAFTLGTITTFMTWSVLWFLMGVLCRRPARSLARS